MEDASEALAQDLALQKSKVVDQTLVVTEIVQDEAFDDGLRLGRQDSESRSHLQEYL